MRRAKEAVRTSRTRFVPASTTTPPGLANKTPATPGSERRSFAFRRAKDGAATTRRQSRLDGLAIQDLAIALAAMEQSDALDLRTFEL